MKRMIFAVVLLIFFPNLSQAADTLIVRQDIAKSETFYWFHNEKVWGSELLYCTGSNPMMVVGITPHFQTKFGAIGIKIDNYFSLKFDASKVKWPLYFSGVDNFTTFNFKDWVLLVRTTPDFNLTKKETQYSGRDYIGFKLNEKWQIQAQAEWLYFENKFSQIFGLGWCHSFTKSTGFDGYLGVGIKPPYKKSGWFAVKLVME
ncbi:MAG: hypothetical protein PHW31_04615 [Candidatus Pacebacteria bacterium]|nr:hypothetical protein [Candidatus Paceibacterota bacterium]